MELKAICLCLVALTLLVLLVNLSRLPTYCRWLVWLISLSLAMEFITGFLHFRGLNMHIAQHAYQLTKLFLVCGFYHDLLPQRRHQQIIKLVFGLYAAALAIYYFFHPMLFWKESLFDVLMEAIICLIFVVVFFRTILFQFQLVNLSKYTAFWINAAYLMYYCACIFVVGFYLCLKTAHAGLTGALSAFNYLLAMFLYATYLIIFLCTATQRN